MLKSESHPYRADLSMNLSFVCDDHNALSHSTMHELVGIHQDAGRLITKYPESLTRYASIARMDAVRATCYSHDIRLYQRQIPPLTSSTANT
jgi:hypothetical protein